MTEFLEIFGNIPIGTIAVVASAVIFIFKIYMQIKKHLIEKYKLEEEREREIKEVIRQVGEYPKWHKHSLDVQKEFGEAIEVIKKAQISNTESLEQLRKEMGEKDATTRRYRILRFNDEILHGIKHTKEHFDQILEDITQYEKYCFQNPAYENNKATLSIKNIEKNYQKCVDDNVFM